MALDSHIQRVINETRNLARVLDVGGSAIPLNTATHVLDALPIFHGAKPLCNSEPIRFSAATIHDICRKPWPFPDRYFDFSFCSNTLEDIRDPIAACEELMRVSLRGYIEVPSRLREAFHHKRHFTLRRILGRPLRVGFGHHRWYCEQEGSGLCFLAKTTGAVWSREHFITRDDIGRDLTADESSIRIFWEGSFPVRERMLIKNGEMESDLLEFARYSRSRFCRN